MSILKELYDQFGPRLRSVVDLYQLIQDGDPRAAQLLGKALMDGDINVADLDHLLSVPRETIPTLEKHMTQYWEGNEPPQAKDYTEVALEALELQIHLKPVEGGRCVVMGIPENGINRKPILLNYRETAPGRRGRRSPKALVDIAPIHRCIHRSWKTHGVTSKNALIIFSQQFGKDLQVSTGTLYFKGSSWVRETTAIKVLRLAYIINRECVTGLEH